MPSFVDTLVNHKNADRYKVTSTCLIYLFIGCILHRTPNLLSIWKPLGILKNCSG